LIAKRTLLLEVIPSGWRSFCVCYRLAEGGLISKAGTGGTQYCLYNATGSEIQKPILQNKCFIRLAFVFQHEFDIMLYFLRLFANQNKKASFSFDKTYIGLKNKIIILLGL
jgi:hypothetical protein